MTERAGINQLKCPNCGELIPVSETIYHQIEEDARQELKAELVRQQKFFAEREEQLNEKEIVLDKTIQSRVQEARQQLELEAAQKARQVVSVEMSDLRRETAEKQQLLEVAQRTELELRKQKRSIEEREKTLELELTRKLDEERRKIEENTSRRLEDEHRLRDAEKDKKLQDAMKANDELRRKLLQGSQQTQGEVLELQLQQLIGSAFPEDQIDPVPKGVAGADLVHRIFSRSGHPCGTIVWETKRTKSWSDSWLQKLKDDQRVLKAEIAILVSETLPKDCQNFKYVNGVWITNPQCALSLAVALRLQLVEVATTKLAAVGKNEKMEVLYRYLSGSEFRQRVEAIVEAFVEMQDNLQEERRVADPWGLANVNAVGDKGADRSHAPVPVGTAATWIVKVVSVFVIALWVVIGFLLWVPLLTRMIFVFTAAVAASMYMGRDPTHARVALEAAMSFYSRGFELIFDSMKGNLQRHGPFVIPESEHVPRMLWELLFSVLFWLGIIGTYWLMGFSIWGRVWGLFS